jgi:hypothetical protein
MAYVPYDPNRPKQKTKDLNAQDIDTYKDAEAAKDRFARQVKGAKADLSAVDVNPYTAKRAMPSTRQASTSMPKPVTSPIRLTSRVDMPKSTSIPVKAPVASKPDRSLQDVLNKPVDQTSFLSKLKESDRASANSKYANTRDFKGDTSLDLSNPKNKSDVVSAPKAKPVVKAAPKVKSQFERMQDAYEGFGKGSDSAANKEVQARLEQRSASTRFATPEKTSTGAGAAFAKGAKGAMKHGGSACKGYAKGGSVRSASSRGDGCATKGHTRGAMR